MVFSFFKKQAEKMPERPAARPRAPGAPSGPMSGPLSEPPKATVSESPAPERKEAPEPLLDLEFTSANMPAAAPASAPTPSVAPPSIDSAATDLDFTDEDFDQALLETSIEGIALESDVDPIRESIEHVVVFFANGQDAAARSMLESLIRSYDCVEGLPFWHLLFDLLQVAGDQAAYEKLGVEFAEVCETSPPAWSRASPTATPSAPAGARVFVLQGVLTAEGAQPVAELAALVEQKVAVKVDCGKLLGCDDEVAGQLAELLRQARQGGVALTLDKVDGFLARLNERLQAGEAGRTSSWLLLLELLQRHGTQESFEERAVDYAVTFELSPPSWEALPAPSNAIPMPLPVPQDDAFHLSGELKNHRFEELTATLAQPQAVILDFSDVRRMDFFSAGQLVNCLAPLHAAGREIVIRGPNHLIAELMAVVGLNKLARIIVPKS